MFQKPHCRGGLVFPAVLDRLDSSGQRFQPFHFKSAFERSGLIRCPGGKTAGVFKLTLEIGIVAASPGD